MRLTKEGIAIIDRDTHISKWVEESGRLDHDQNALPRILPHIKEGGIIFDIGAYIGDHTQAYVEKGIVYAFEPNPEAFECLKHNIAGTAILCPIALSDKVHGYEIDCTIDNVGMARIIKGKAKRTTTIDIFCKKNNVLPDFIKIDVEGNEVNVLNGGRETILNSLPTMVIEVNEGALVNFGTSRNELFKLLDDLGYGYVDIYGRPLSELSIQFDILARPLKVSNQTKRP